MDCAVLCILGDSFPQDAFKNGKFIGGKGGLVSIRESHYLLCRAITSITNNMQHIQYFNNLQQSFYFHPLAAVNEKCDEEGVKLAPTLTWLQVLHRSLRRYEKQHAGPFIDCEVSAADKPKATKRGASASASASDMALFDKAKPESDFLAPDKKLRVQEGDDANKNAAVESESSEPESLENEGQFLYDPNHCSMM
jgi:hypothetical protein